METATGTYTNNTDARIRSLLLLPHYVSESCYCSDCFRSLTTIYPCYIPS